MRYNIIYSENICATPPGNLPIMEAYTIKNQWKYKMLEFKSQHKATNQKIRTQITKQLKILYPD